MRWRIQQTTDLLLQDILEAAIRARRRHIIVGSAAPTEAYFSVCSKHVWLFEQAWHHILSQQAGPT